jgi:hypothetical protein
VNPFANIIIIIYLPKGNPLSELIYEHSDVFFHVKEKLYSEKNIICLDQDGNQYDSKTCKEMDDLVFEIEADLEQKRKEKVDFCGLNYGKYFQDKLEEHIENDSDDMKQVRRVMFEKSVYLQCIQNGCNKLSDCAIDMPYEEFPGELEEFPAGYSKLIEFLIEQLPKSTIKLNHVVLHISRVGDNLKVDCKNGQVFYTKHVIFTCSLGVLKKHNKSMFDQFLLDHKKIEAINKLSIGLYFKAYLVFDDMTFFPSSTDAIHLISFDGQSDTDEPHNWLAKIPKLEKIYENVLRIRIIGNCAPYVENLSDEELCSKITEHMKRLLKNNNIPLPKRLIRFKVFFFEKRIKL